MSTRGFPGTVSVPNGMPIPKRLGLVMNVTVTGATGLIGTRLVAALRERGDDVIVLSRDPARAQSALGVPAQAWDLLAGPPPESAIAGRDGVVHLAGEPVAQRWSARSKEAIRASRETGTRNLVEALRTADPRPGVLVSSSAVGYYGKHGDERVSEDDGAGSDFLAQVCVAWEREALAAAEVGVRVVVLRTGIVLDPGGGALKTMLPPFKAGVGGPVAGGAQYMPWIHVDDVVGMYLAALDEPSWSGPVNATAPEPVTNAVFTKALGRVLGRPTVAPAPAFALRLAFGEMADATLLTGARVRPSLLLASGYRFRFPDLEGALRHVLGRTA